MKFPDWVQVKRKYYRLTFDEYTTGLVRYKKVEPEGQFQGQKWDLSSTVLPVRTSFYFVNRNFFNQSILYPKSTLHSRWEEHQIMKIALFSVSPLITLTCRTSLINPVVTNKFYFGILIRVASEIGFESLTHQ